MSLASRVRRSLCCALALAVVAACGDDDGPPVAPLQVAGNYTATTFTTTTLGGTPRDALAEGGSISITLSGAGFTDGTLIIPPSPGQGVVVANLNGSWTISGTTVDLDHPNDTFLRKMPFEFTGSALEGDRTFSDVRIRVTLTRDDTP